MDHRLDIKTITQEIIDTTPFTINNFRILQKLDPNDHYWQITKNLDTFAYNGTFIETAMVVSWIGKTFHPKTILEIGTRTGGSLISLLANYNNFNDVEVVSFDLWREYISTTFLSRKITKFISHKKDDEYFENINISEKKLKPIARLIHNLSIRKVNRNLSYFNIPTSKIRYISGDSKKTVPAYFHAYPAKKFDYILVDGAHDEKTALIDLQNIAGHVADNGVIAFDDLSDRSYNLMNVWNRFKVQYADQFEFIEIECRKGIGLAFKKS